MLKHPEGIFQSLRNKNNLVSEAHFKNPLHFLTKSLSKAGFYITASFLKIIQIL